MVIVLKNDDIKKKDQIIAEKNKEGYTLINISEAFDTMVSGPHGSTSVPSLVLEFKKI